MKKYFYSVLAASMLFACSQEDIVDVTKGEGQQVTFQVEIPGVESRAIANGIEVGAGKYANKLIYAMYEEDKNDVLISNFVTDDDNDGKFDVTVPMAKDIKYDILFLAYNEGNCAFNIDNSDAKLNNLKAITLKSDLKANQEQYDAFISRLDSKGIDAAAKTTVTLKRPFAQVNVATTLKDLEDMKTLQSEVVTSDFVIYNAPNTLNVFTGEVTGTQTITYSVADILKKYDATAYPYNEQITVDATTYYYLGMSYVLAGAESSTHDAAFKFYREGSEQVSNLDVTGMPIQANYRTNILGTILTQQESYEIVIDAVFGEPANSPAEEQTQKVVVSTAAELKAAIDAAAGVNETRSTVYKQTLIELLPGTYTGAFNIDGKSLILMSNDEENTIIDGLVHGLSSRITVRNLTLKNATPAQSGITNRTGADGYCMGGYATDFIIENCTFDITAKGAINIYAANNDTEQEIDGVKYEFILKNSTFNCNGERPIRGKTNSYISGCTFNNMYRYAIQVQGNNQYAGTETVTFIDNKIVEPCKTSGQTYAAAVSISGSQLIEDAVFNISGNTMAGTSSIAALKSLVYDIAENVKITTCTLNGEAIQEFNCQAIEGVTDAKEVVKVDGVALVNGEYHISNANGMFWFANEVNKNGNTFSGKSVKLTADIDLDDRAWTPVGQTGATQFKGTFNGQEYTISNLNIDATSQTGKNYSTGIFGWLNAANVKNINVVGATVKGNHNVGVIAGYLETAGCTIENCHVSGATVECHHANGDACGDKAGVIVGHAGNAGVVVKDCTASESTVSAGRDAGQVVGAALEANVTGCSATNVTVTALDGCTDGNAGGNIRNEVIGRLL